MKGLLIFTVMALGGAMTVVSCQKDIESEEKRDDSGIVYEKKPIWRVENTSDQKQPGGASGYSWILDGDLLDTYASKPYSFKPDMALLDGKTGQRKWTWNNVLRDTEPVSIGRNTVVPYENQLFYNYGPRNYCVDLKTGQTIWRKDRDYTTYNGIARELGSTYFVKGTPNAIFRQVGIEDRVYQGDIRTGEETEITALPYNRDKWKTNTNWRELIGFVSDLHPVVVGADTLLITIYNEPSITRHQYEAYIGLYNLTKRQWVYDRKRLNPQWTEAFNSSWLTVVGDKMFTILNNAVACSNWRTGELIWFRPLPSFAAIPTPIENKYLAVFSTDSRLFLLDINTGQTIWEKNREIMGVTSQMYYDQGILYYLTANLNAIEIPGGKKLWSISSPTNGKIDGHFTGFVVGSPGKNGQKGRIFTRTGYHTYCFEAIK